jgi:hypothetical protein
MMSDEDDEISYSGDEEALAIYFDKFFSASY